MSSENNEMTKECQDLKSKITELQTYQIETQ